jgi:hypothetical protein
MRSFVVFSAAMALVQLAACAPAERAAPAAAATPARQGWSARQIQDWYEASQGSRLLPLAWADALEVADSQEFFFGDTHMASLRYLPRTRSDGRRLPAGFAIDVSPPKDLSWTAMTWSQDQKAGAPWLGLTCAACHTGELTYGDAEPIRIEGGPGLGDFQGLLAHLRDALSATRDQSDKFDRFAKAVLKTGDTPQNRDKLRGALTTLIDHEEALGRLNATDLEYGPGRLDAFGHIYNKVAFVVAGAEAPRQPADAPVSYPFLWNVPQHDRVQWNGIADNTPIATKQTFDVGALGRNAGEVIGVFADIRVRSGTLQGYASSANIQNLVAFEQQLEKLRPPAWPKDVIPLSQDHATLAKRGADLFKRHCASCHVDLDPADLTAPIKAQMALFRSANPPGTDIWMACNAYVRVAPSGTLEGTPRKFFKGVPLEEDAYLSDLLTTTVAGALFQKKGEVIRVAGASFFGVNRPTVVTGQVTTGQSLKERQEQRCMTEESPILGYKARPLTGIWATGPYLHNGSVPTLYDLLLPEAKRPKTFRVGTRAFDPVRVGFDTRETAPGNTWTFRTVDSSGKPIPGNSNKGHTYAVDELEKNDADRWALVEYLKTR